jgi:hypothetical protein
MSGADVLRGKARLTRCRNCGRLPTIRAQEGRFPVLLEHKSASCPAEFSLESHQLTRDECVADWNHRNKPPAAARRRRGG